MFKTTKLQSKMLFGLNNKSIFGIESKAATLGHLSLITLNGNFWKQKWNNLSGRSTDTAALL